MSGKNYQNYHLVRGYQNKRSMNEMLPEDNEQKIESNGIEKLNFLFFEKAYSPFSIHSVEWWPVYLALETSF